MVAVSILLGAAAFVLILDNSLLLAFAMGFVVSVFGSVLIPTLVYLIAGQLFCEVPEDCEVVFQYRRGGLTARGEGGHTTWAFPLVEWMRAVVPVQPLLFNIANLELYTPSAHVVAKAAGTYKVESPALLVYHFTDDAWRSILGIPRRLDRESTAGQAETLLRTLLKDAISSAATGNTPVEILHNATPIKIGTRKSLRTTAGIRGILVIELSELELHVRGLPAP